MRGRKQIAHKLASGCVSAARSLVFRGHLRDLRRRNLAGEHFGAPGGGIALLLVRKPVLYCQQSFAPASVLAYTTGPDSAIWGDAVSSAVRGELAFRSEGSRRSDCSRDAAAGAGGCSSL